VCVAETGATRIVGKEKTVTCATGETAVHWARNVPKPEAPAAVGSVPERVEDSQAMWEWIASPHDVYPDLSCGTGGDIEDPKMVVTLETHGRPVVVSFTITIDLTNYPKGWPPGAGPWYLIYPQIDGEHLGDPLLGHYNVAAFRFDPDVLFQRVTFHKVVPLAAGVHRFSVVMDCPYPLFWLGMRWMDIYEIR
jgi:hypothetical protein